jgi:DUF4097 and DUF4098 domain-containing protein YvlB/exonuclease VII large subunit
MNERERILDLVKQGILSTEEGLDLLESLAKKEEEKHVKKEFSTEEKITPANDKSLDEEIEKELEDLDEEIDRISEEVEQTEDEEVQSELEEELEELANEVNQYSADLDRVNEKLSEAKGELRDAEEELREIKEERLEEKKEAIDDLTEDIENLQKELRLIESIEEVDNREEIEQIKDEIVTLQEELEELKAEDDEEVQGTIEKLEEQIAQAKEDVSAYQEEKAEIMRKLHSSKMKQWTTRAKQVSKRLEIPEEWKEGASEAIEKAGEQIEITGKDLGGFIRNTIQSAKGVFDHVEWTDMNIRVPKLSATEFEHEWLFEDSTATILDFKNANGNVKFESSTTEDIKISAKIKLYGKMDEETPLEAFNARAIIEEDEDKLTFHVPNKRVAADMIVYLPERTYDYLAVNLLNGNVTSDPLKVKDIYVKSTNGNITFYNLEATMLETKGTNGEVTLKGATLRDLLVSTVNGSIRFKGAAQSSDVSTTNGDIRFTLTGDEATRVKSTSVNGNVKIAIPESVGVEGEAKTVFGKVKSRLSGVNASEEKAQNKHAFSFHREGAQEELKLFAKTTTGNVLLKDTE